MHDQHNRGLQAQLSRVRPNIRTKNDIKDPSPSPMNWAADGVDHINIWEQAETELGKALSHNTHSPFKHSIFGRFNSMECFWHYIQSEQRDDRIRVMNGRSVKAFAKKLKQKRVTNFRAIIMDSNWQRIRQHKTLITDLRNSTLPLDCYYVTKGVGLRVRPTFFNWLVMGFDEIRKAIQEDREPDFTFLLDKKDSGIYDFALQQNKDIAARKDKAVFTKPQEDLKTSGQADQDGQLDKLEEYLEQGNALETVH